MVKKKQPEKVEKSTNFNDVLVKLIDSVYNLVNSGNIVGVILLYFCFQVFYITQKLSTEALDKYLERIFSLDYFYLYPMGAALSLSLVANYYQAKVYRRHIEVLVETRKELIHGLTSGSMKNISNHTTSGIDSLETTNDC